MNTVVTLNLSRVMRAGAQLPAYAVADLIPVVEGRAEPKEQIAGVVLELRDVRKLRARVPVPAGPLVVNVRFPNGALLTQQVEVRGGDATVSFALSGRDEGSEPPVSADVREERENVRMRSPARHAADAFAPGEASVRSKWRVQEIPPHPGDQGAAVWAALDDMAHEVVSERQANLGIARLKSQERSAVTSRVSGRPTRLDSQAIVGTVSAVQPIKLYGDVDSLTTQWKVPLRYGPRTRYSQDDEGRLERYFAVAYKAEAKALPQQVACIPGRWRRSDRTWATVHVRYDPVALRARGEGRIRIEVGDPEYGALLEYLQTGDAESSAALFVKAKEGLRLKFLNPYAAAAGGYALLYSGTTHDAQYWSEWMFNLASNFPALPDGSTLLATMLLQSPIGQMHGGLAKEERHSMALDAVIEAVRRGPPLYRLGLVLLSSNLRILEGVYREDRDVIRRISHAQDYVQALSLRADPTQPFSVFDVEADAAEEVA